MQKAKRFSIGFLIAAAVVTVVSTATVAPPEVEAGRCICPPVVSQTPIMSGDGATCALATADLESKLDDEANCFDGFCHRELVITMACFSNPAGGQWVKGKLNYTCLECIQTPGF